MVHGAISIIISLFVSFAWAHQVERAVDQKYTFDLHENHSQISEAEVLALVQILDKEFGPQIQNPSKPISQNFNWSQIYMGAGAQMNEGNFAIMLWGGMVRAPYMNYGVLTSILCHEVGHRLAGEPRQFLGGQWDWSSAEGQSDHFAATVCLPKMYEVFQKSFPQFLRQELEPSASNLCQSSKDREKCEWVATSGIDMIQFLQVYYERDIPFAQPELIPKEKVSETLHTKYPSYQCRMEIFKVGAQCGKGLQCPRQACWFKAP